MINAFFPITFFLIFFTYSKSISYSILFFMGLILDQVYYSLFYFHTILFTFFYLIGLFLPPCKNIFVVTIRTILFTSLYFLFVFLITKNFSILVYGYQMLWNIVLAILLFSPTRIHIKKKYFGLFFG